MLVGANFRMIRLAREYRALSQSALATRSGVSQPVLSRIEANLRPATDGEVDRLAAALAFPVAFFYEPDAPSGAPLFRKREIRSATRYREVQARVNVAVLAARRIMDAGITMRPRLEFPSPHEFADTDPSWAAKRVRDDWRLPPGPVDDVTRLIEAAGGLVLHADLGADEVSAAFVSATGDPYLWFVVNTNESAGDRIRLSLAHELGHAVLHRFLPLQDERRTEPEAYAFGAALLLPPREFDRHVPPDLTLGQARDLKRAFGVSIQAIVRAAFVRGLITQSRYQSLYKQLSARGWRHREPDTIRLEEPELWPAALAVHRERHGFSTDDLAATARLATDTIVSLLPRDFAGTGLRVVPSTSPPSEPQPPTSPTSQLRLAEA